MKEDIVEKALNKFNRMSATETLCANVMRRYGWELKLNFDNNGNPESITAIATKKAVTHDGEQQKSIHCGHFGDNAINSQDMVSLFNFWCEQNKIPSERLFMSRRIFV
jgi:hypothetical protein